MTYCNDKLKQLLEEYLSIHQSEKNAQRKKLWHRTRSIILDKWHGCPADISKIGIAPVCVWLSNDLLSELLDIDLKRYYTEPLYFLEKWLESKIFHFNNFEDDNYYDNFIPLWMGEGLEATLFGMNMNYEINSEPWISRSDPPLKEQFSIDGLKEPDFHKSGVMPLAIKFYEEISEITNSYGIEVGFPVWGNGPVMTCDYLHGIEQMCLGYLTQPELIKSLLVRVSEIRNNWHSQRLKYLGIADIGKAEIWDDDLSVPIIPPKIFSEMICSVEKSISDFHGGIAYWHDCGPADPYMEKVREIGPIELMHSGPFTDLGKVAKLFGKTSALEHNVKPMEIYIEENELRKQILKIKEVYSSFDVKAYTVRLTGYKKPGLSFQENLEYIKVWLSCAKQIFHNI